MGGFQFTRVTASFAAQGVCGHETSMPMQPAAEPDFAGKFFCLTRQVNEDRLGDVLGPMRVTFRQANRRGLNQVQIARGHFPKRAFGTVIHIFREQSLSLRHLALSLKTR
jgi:hypothetical protein